MVTLVKPYREMSIVLTMGESCMGAATPRILDHHHSYGDKGH